MKNLTWMVGGLAVTGMALVTACGADDGGYSDGNAGLASGDPYGDRSYPGQEQDPAISAGGAPNEEPPPTNPFVVVEHDPLSTFAADVDTASYDYFRTQARSSALPPAEYVRLEEFVNFFDYEYPGPAAEAEHPFAIHLDAAPNLVTRDTTLLRVGIQGVEVERDPAQEPANLVFLVDVSGSMSDELDTVQLTLQRTVELLAPTDTIAIVTYASSPGTLLPATPVSEKETILDAINGLSSGGSTNGAGGIEAAYAEAEEAFADPGINHILICTDGDFNVGVTSDESLEELIVRKRKSGITLTALGFGSGNYNDSMMERISNAGNGIAGYIGSDADAEEYVRDRMLQTLVQIAKDMKIQVEFNGEHVYAYRLLGYENRAIADDDFRDDIVDAGEIGSGHSVTALYEVVLTEAMLPDSADAPPLDDGAMFSGEPEVAAEDLVLVKVRYKQPGAAETDPAAEVSAQLTPDAVVDGFAASDSSLQWAAAIAAFAEILKESPYADVESVAAIESVIETQTDRGGAHAEFVELFGQVKGQL